MNTFQTDLLDQRWDPNNNNYLPYFGSMYSMSVYSKPLLTEGLLIYTIMWLP